MSELSVEPQIRIIQKPRKNQLKISVDSNEQQELAPASKLWLQYSHFNVKTPTNQKFPIKNTSQLVQFSNNLCKEGGTSEYAPVEGNEHQHGTQDEQENKKTEVIVKQEFISRITLTEEERNNILGNKSDKMGLPETDAKLEWVQMRESLNSRASHEEKDAQGGKRKFLLQRKKQQNLPKQVLGCSSCFIM